MRCIRYIIVLVAMLVACSPDPTNILDEEVSLEDRYGDESEDGDDSAVSFDAVSSSIASLKAMSVSSLSRITDVVSITGQVTANDLYGEFSEMLVIEDDSGAIVVSVDLEDQFYTYAVGTTLTLYCADLWLANSGGMVTLGAESMSDAAVDALSLSDLEGRLLYRGYEEELRSPTSITIEEFSTSEVSRLVMLEGLSLASLEESFVLFCEYDEETGRRLSTSHTLRDSEGHEVELFVPSTVVYAEDTIPSGEFSVCAILFSYYGSYSLRITEMRIW